MEIRLHQVDFYRLQGVHNDIMSLYHHLSKKDMTVELSHVDDFVGKVKQTQLSNTSTICIINMLQLNSHIYIPSHLYFNEMSVPH